MQQAGKLYVVGIGYKPLGQNAHEIVKTADVILASRRLAEVFEKYDEYRQAKDRIKIINNVDETIAFISSSIGNPQSSIRNIVLLASGDPLFFGIGRRVVEEFGRDAVEILPDLSSVQEAFARIKQPWDDALLISLHGGPNPEKRRKLKYELGDIPSLLEQHNKIAILTDKENNPAAIAKMLQAHPHPDHYINSPHPYPSPLEGEGQRERGLYRREGMIRMHVCERLGYPDEKITHGTSAEIARMAFSEPNVVVLVKDEGKRQKKENVKQRTDIRFGLREEEIHHERGLITKDEVRAATLHKLMLPGTGVLWDIGAGSGSVSLEAARLCPELRIIALEKEMSRAETIRTNMRKYNIQNVEIVQGVAPGALSDMPSPDRVFIGGSGGMLGDIVKFVSGKMVSGIIVINAVTLETLNQAISALDKYGFAAEVSELSVSRSKIISGKRQMAALNPVFIVKGGK